jgi:acetolactate synthase small subunit
MKWIIDFRGDLSETSELNMDGSVSMRATSIVLGDNLPAALTNLIGYLKDREITLSSITRCEMLSPEIISNATPEEANNITEATERLTQERPVSFAFAISSEAEENEPSLERQGE